MISNERQWPHLRTQRHFNRQDNRQPYRQAYDYAPQPPRPHVQEDTLKTCEVQIEKKFFVLTLKENARGRFIRITEENGGKRNCIIIPGTGLKDFQKLLEEMVQAADAIPAKTDPAQEQP
jgi:hypothetical protein